MPSLILTKCSNINPGNAAEDITNDTIYILLSLKYQQDSNVSHVQIPRVDTGN